ncbi:MAG: glycosyltransferase family 4 protein [Clostridia bacterium]|nr:glycosyltransferase family 4 protein [Clostridia bacterium]
MNICLIMPNVFPVPATKGGATESLMTNLLKENEKSGKINFTCVSVYEEKAYNLSKNYKFTKFIYIKQKRDNLDLTFQSEDKNFVDYMDEVYKNIKDADFDFIIIEGGDISGYEYLLKNFPKEKCLVHIHGNVLGNNKINDKIYNKFIAISDFTRKLIMEDNIISDDKIELLYNAIYVQDFDKKISDNEKIELRKKYDINSDDVVILFLGRTIKEKGVKELILSFKKMKNLDKCKLLIVGSANYGENIKTEFDYELEEISKEVKDKIKFTGYVSNENLYKIHNICDIAVVPSMFKELFGLVVVENMSSALPLVVTNSGGIPEVVDKECAFIVDINENLIKNMTEKLDFLVDNPDIRKKMGEHGKQRAKIFGMESYLENFYNLIKKIKNENAEINKI